VAAATWKERLLALKEVWPILCLFLLVIGGLYLGVFTSTECAGVGAFGALLIALIKRQLNWENFIAAVGSTFEITCMIFIILIGAYIFGAFLAISELPHTLAELATQSELPPVMVLVFILFIYLILGSISDIISSVVLTIPIVFPIIIALGFDPIWFGVIVVIMLEMGLITPPIGLNVFIISGVAKDIPISTVFRGIAPFLIAMAVCIAILIFFPQIALFLPTLMKGG
jgi:tripartite ATP-independent transporter DctM subunit